MLPKVVVVIVAAEFYRVDSPWPDKIRVRSGYADPTVVGKDAAEGHSFRFPNATIVRSDTFTLPERL